MADRTDPTEDRSGYEVTVTRLADVHRDDSPRTVNARILATTAETLAYELAALACEYHPDGARRAVRDHARRIEGSTP